MSFLQCIKWAGLQPIFQNFLLRSWLLFSFTFLFIPSSSKASANHSISLSTSALAREQRGVGHPRDDRNSFCSLVLPGFHPAHHLAAYELPAHPQWHLGFKHLFFSHFFSVPLIFTFLKKSIWLWQGSLTLSIRGKPTEKWLQADYKGGVQEGQAHVIAPSKYSPASSYFQWFV